MCGGRQSKLSNLWWEVAMLHPSLGQTCDNLPDLLSTMLQLTLKLYHNSPISWPWGLLLDSKVAISNAHNSTT